MHADYDGEITFSAAFTDYETEKLKPNFSPYSKRLVTFQNLSNWYSSQKTHSRSLHNSLQKNRAGSTYRADESLDLVRIIFQKSLNKEIDHIVKEFTQKYLLPAAKNIENNGVEVTETDFNVVYHRILEEAKNIYPLAPKIDEENVGSIASKPVPDSFLSASTVSQQQQPQQQQQQPSAQQSQLLPITLINKHIPADLRKRKDSDTESDISQKSTGAATKKKAKTQTRPQIQKTPGNASTSARKGAACSNTAFSNIKSLEIPREDVEKWNPARLNERTVFVLGSRANSALGLSAQRGRIYIKHPGLFRYTGDHDDKKWLVKNKKETVMSGGKAFMVILDDVIELARLPEYRNNKVMSMSGFCAPDFILDKMKTKMKFVYDQLRSKYNLPEAMSSDNADVSDPILSIVQGSPSDGEYD